MPYDRGHGIGVTVSDIAPLKTAMGTRWEMVSTQIHFLRADFDHFLNGIFSSELWSHACGINTYALLHYSCS